MPDECEHSPWMTAWLAIVYVALSIAVPWWIGFMAAFVVLGFRFVLG